MCQQLPNKEKWTEMREGEVQRPRVERGALEMVVQQKWLYNIYDNNVKIEFTRTLFMAYLKDLHAHKRSLIK